MTKPIISIEPLSEELMDAYIASGMERGKAGYSSLEWAFGNNAAPFSVARSGGQIVGMSGYIQSRMQFGPEVGTAFQAVDSFVSESMRGKGIFTRLAQAYDAHTEESGGSLVWGFPNDNAAPTWFGKLGWHSHGQVPFLIKPLRSGFFLRKIGLQFDFTVTHARDQNVAPLTEIGDWADVLWASVAPGIGAGTVRDRKFLSHRLFACPQASQYRVLASSDQTAPAIFVTREAEKHGGRIAYVMEALGGASLEPLMMSELGRLASRGVELALAWSFPWSPNCRTLRKAGFIPLPERLRPIRIWFGSTPKSGLAAHVNEQRQWYLSYLDSDTV